MFKSDTIKPGDIIRNHDRNNIALVVGVRDGDVEDTEDGLTQLELVWLSVSGRSDRTSKSHMPAIMTEQHTKEYFLTSVEHGVADVVGNLNSVLAGLDQELTRMFCTDEPAE